MSENSPPIGRSTGQDLTIREQTTSVPADIFDESNPRSMINLIPPIMAEKVRVAVGAKPGYFHMDERALAKHLAKLSRNTRGPNVTDNRLRLKFWDEYDRAQHENTKMNMTNVYAGVCSREYFSSCYLASPEKVCWLILPPASYVVKMEEALAFGIEQMRDILDEPNFFWDKGRKKVNVKLLELKAKIVHMLDNRVKGAVPQQIEQRSMNVNVSSKDVSQLAMMGTMEEIERRLQTLRAADRANPPPKDVEAIVEPAKESESEEAPPGDCTPEA
jgi:hypothetical protein